MRENSLAPHITLHIPGTKTRWQLSFKAGQYKKPKPLHTYSNKLDVDIVTVLTKRYKRKENQYELEL